MYAYANASGRQPASLISSAFGLGLDDALLDEVLKHDSNSALNIDLVRLDVDLSVLGRLVGGGDTRELLDLASASLLVKALGVTRLDDGERSVNKDLNEGDRRVVLLVKVAGELAVGNVRRDEGREGQRGGGGEEERDLADAADLGRVSLLGLALVAG
jgi:hypothetical protein